MTTAARAGQKTGPIVQSPESTATGVPISFR